MRECRAAKSPDTGNVGGILSPSVMHKMSRVSRVSLDSLEKRETAYSLEWSSGLSIFIGVYLYLTLFRFEYLCH